MKTRIDGSAYPDEPTPAEFFTLAQKADDAREGRTDDCERFVELLPQAAGNDG